MIEIRSGKNLVSGSGGDNSNIQHVKVNGSEITPDADKTIDLTIATKTSDLINDNNFVKDTDTATTDKFGVVKPDNSTITVQDGVLSANIDGLIDDTTSTNNKTYSSNKLENDFAKNADVLTLTNSIIYTPTGDYHPATKKYVDDALEALNGIMELKSRVDTVDDLPNDAETGWVYYVGLIDAESFETYVKLSDGNWLRIGSTNISLDGYLKIDDADILLKTKITICSSLPIASDTYVNQCYFNTTDGCIYQCILDTDDVAYKWNKIVSNESCIVVSNIEPTDTTKLWIDNSITDKMIIKAYDITSSTWKAVSSSLSSDVVESINYSNGILYVKYTNDDVVREYIVNGIGANIKESLINGNITINDKEIKVYDDTDVMKKLYYASEVNEGNVKVADYAEAVKEVADNSDPNVYYGHNSEGITGLYPFPIGTQDESKLITKEYLNVTEGWEKIITESLIPLNDKVMISVLKTVSNPTDIDVTIKEFNLENEITINHSDKVSIKDNQISIQNEFVGDNLTNSDGLLETDLSSYTQINRCEVK